MITKISAIILMVSVPGMATAQTCSPPDVRSATPLAEIVARAEKSAVVKDEFESTAAFEARAAASGMAAQRVWVSVPLSGQTTYDADTQTVSLSKYAAGGVCAVRDSSISTEARKTVFGTPVGQGSYVGQTYCVEHVASSRPGESYEASNSYGAKVEVSVTHRSIDGIVFGYGSMGQELYAGRPKYSSAPAFQFTAAPNDARSLKENAMLLFEVTPRSPFFSSGSYYYEPKIDSPSEVFAKHRLLIAQGHCAALADRVTGKVYQTIALSGGG